MAGVMGLGERLDAVRAEASGRGVTVVVDLHGKPVDLAFTREALSLRPDDLAAVIRDLAAEAATAAVTEARSILADVVPSDLLPS
ncbi:hypothetical protein LZG04_08370 [Saccharothrix sp. S26]|uniref:hypothetical protein n=1 Tax=Saccharothrix sp. S26 TaxID=2907215 RepID=UPI001F2D691D|nr:hypothetical protein [Saccharothrix sp. S26]MCE6994816.1 hypothetical protein [Saccharothrix sp. S26]